MAENKVNEVAWNMTRSLTEINRAITTSVTTAQERNIRFSQGVVENSMEVLKSHVDATRTLAEEMVEKPDKQAELLQDMVNTGVAAYDRNLRLAQSVFNDGIEVLKNSALDTRSLAQEMIELSQKQQEQFQELAQETTKAYMDFLRMPLAYYRQALGKVVSMAQ
jgi:hypothetical protein